MSDYEIFRTCLISKQNNFTLAIIQANDVGPTSIISPVSINLLYYYKLPNFPELIKIYYSVKKNTAIINMAS